MEQECNLIKFWNCPASVKMTLDKNAINIQTEEYHKENGVYEGDIATLLRLLKNLLRYLKIFLYKRKGRKYKSFVFHAIALVLEQRIESYILSDKTGNGIVTFNLLSEMLQIYSNPDGMCHIRLLNAVVCSETNNVDLINAFLKQLSLKFNDATFDVAENSEQKYFTIDIILREDANNRDACHLFQWYLDNTLLEIRRNVAKEWNVFQEEHADKFNYYNNFEGLNADLGKGL